MRKRKNIILSETDRPNKLKQAIEAGTSVEGLKGFIETSIDAIDEDGYQDSDGIKVCMEVTCLRVEAKGCGVTIIAKPIKGYGEFKVSPCQWYDDVKSLQERKEYLARCHEVQRRLDKMFIHSYVSIQKQNAIEYVEGMGEIEVTKLRREVEDVFGITSETDIKNIFKKVDISKVKQYLFDIVCRDLSVKKEDVSFYAR